MAVKMYFSIFTNQANCCPQKFNERNNYSS